MTFYRVVHDSSCWLARFGRTAGLIFGIGLAFCSAASAQIMIEGTATQVTNVADGQSAPSISGNIVVYTDDSIGNLVVRFIDLGPPQIDTLVAGGPGDQRLHDVDGTNIVYASKDMLARRPTQFS